MHSSFRYLLVASLACFMSLAGRSFADDAETQTTEPPTLGWQIESSHTILGANDTTFYTRILVQAAKVETQRPPLNLALVFDRSGSMKEEAKIGYLREAG
jgi:hypothetical protein